MAHSQRPGCLKPDSCDRPTTPFPSRFSLRLAAHEFL